MMTIADVIKQLVEAHEEGKDINLNKSVSANTVVMKERTSFLFQM